MEQQKYGVRQRILMKSAELFVWPQKPQNVKIYCLLLLSLTYKMNSVHKKFADTVSQAEEQNSRCANKNVKKFNARNFF